MSKPRRVAIITRTKDRPLLLPRAVDSVLAQDFDDWTHVIINDGGQPGPVNELVDSKKSIYADRVHVIHNERSIGMEAASNRAIENSSSEFLVIHDDDDSWDPKFLSACVRYMDGEKRYPSLGGVTTGFIRIHERIENGRVIEESREDISEWRGQMLLWQMCSRNLFPPISFLYRRSAYEAVGPYSADLPVQGDWEINLRFLAKFDIGMLEDRLAYYHFRAPTRTDIYGNTVAAGADLHGVYASIIRNRLLRDDLAKGQFGLGYLVNAAYSELQVFEAAEFSRQAARAFLTDRDKLASKLRRFGMLRRKQPRA